MTKENGHQPGVGASERKAKYFPVLPVAEISLPRGHLQHLIIRLLFIFFFFNSSIFSVASYVKKMIDCTN